MVKAYEMPRFAITLVSPTATFAAKQYSLVGVNANGEMVQAVSGAKAVGVLQTPGIKGEPCNVMVSGVSFTKFESAVAAGQEVEAGATGFPVPATTGKSNGICLVGGAADAIGCILLK